MSPVRYELGINIPEDGILHSHRRENPKSYMSVYYLHDVNFLIEIYRHGIGERTSA
jgi:hypothetical protein